MSAIQFPMTTPGSLRSLMDGLTALQAKLPAQAGVQVDGLQPLHLYRWRPDTPDPPALWNVMRPSTSEQRDTARIRDTIVIATRIGFTYSDAETVGTQMEDYADAYRALVDPNFWDGQRTPPIMSGSAAWAIRSQMASFSEDFGSVTLSGIEFTQSFWVDRHNR